MLFSLAEHMLSGPAAVALAAPMYWVLDVTINVLQTPHRALVADLASEEQQLPMQVVLALFLCGSKGSNANSCTTKVLLMLLALLLLASCYWQQQLSLYTWLCLSGSPP